MKVWETKDNSELSKAQKLSTVADCKSLPAADSIGGPIRLCGWDRESNAEERSRRRDLRSDLQLEPVEAVARGSHVQKVTPKSGHGDVICGVTSSSSLSRRWREARMCRK
ncbi:hypothetical protein J6590_020312 [Homalodisca vitripennis]|nr:hypothetical protein J6590_020312 [Homalodisca vitripennis]